MPDAAELHTFDNDIHWITSHPDENIKEKGIIMDNLLDTFRSLLHGEKKLADGMQNAVPGKMSPGMGLTLPGGIVHRGQPSEVDNNGYQPIRAVLFMTMTLQEEQILYGTYNPEVQYNALQLVEHIKRLLISIQSELTENEDKRKLNDIMIKCDTLFQSFIPQHHGHPTFHQQGKNSFIVTTLVFSITHMSSLYI